MKLRVLVFVVCAALCLQASGAVNSRLHALVQATSKTGSLNQNCYNMLRGDDANAGMILSWENMAAAGTTNLQEGGAASAKTETGAVSDSPAKVVQVQKQLCGESTAEVPDSAAKAKLEVCKYFEPRVLVAARMVAAATGGDTNLFRGAHMSEGDTAEVQKICKDRSQSVCYSMARRVRLCIAEWFKDATSEISTRERKFVDCVSTSLCDAQYNSYSGEKDINVVEKMKPVREVLEDISNALQALVDKAKFNRQEEAIKAIVGKLAENGELVKMIPSLQQKVKQSQEELTRSVEALDRLKEQHASVEESLAAITSEKEVLQTKQDQDKTELQRLNSELDQSTGQQQDLSSQILDTTQQVSECEKDQTNSEDNRAKLQEALEAAQRAIADLQLINNAAKQDLTSLEQTLAQERSAHDNKKKDVEVAIAKAQAASAKEKRQINLILPQIEIIVKQMDERAKRLEEVLEIVHCVQPATDGNPSPSTAVGCGEEQREIIEKFKRDANDPDTDLYQIIQGENQDGATALKTLVPQSFLQVGEHLTHMESAVRRHLSRRLEALKQHTRAAAKSSAREVPAAFADLDRMNTMAWVDGKIVNAADELHNIRAVFATIKELLDMHSDLQKALQGDLEQEHSDLRQSVSEHESAKEKIALQLSSLKAEEDEVSDAMGKLREGIAAQEKEKQMLTQAAEAMESDLKKRKDQLEDVRRAVEAAAALLPTHKAKLSGCQEQAGKVHAEVEELLKSVAVAQKEMDTTCAVVNELLAQKTARDLEQDIQRAKNDQAIRNLESAHQQEAAQLAQFGSLYRELQALRDSLNNDLHVIAEAIIEALDHAPDGNDLHTKVKNHHEKVKSLKEKNAELRASKVVAPTTEFGADFDVEQTTQEKHAALTKAKAGAHDVAEVARVKMDKATKKAKGTEEPDAEPEDNAEVEDDEEEVVPARKPAVSHEPAVSEADVTVKKGKPDNKKAEKAGTEAEREDAEEDEEEVLTASKPADKVKTGQKGAKDVEDEEDVATKQHPQVVVEDEEEDAQTPPPSPSGSETHDSSSISDAEKQKPKAFKIKAREFPVSGSGAKV